MMSIALQPFSGVCYLETTFVSDRRRAVESTSKRVVEKETDKLSRPWVMVGNVDRTIEAVIMVQEFAD